MALQKRSDVRGLTRPHQPPASVLYSRTPARPWIRSSAVPTVAPKAARGARGSSRILVARPTLPHHQHHHRTSKLWWSIAGGFAMARPPTEGRKPASIPVPRRKTRRLPSRRSQGRQGHHSAPLGALSTRVFWPHTPRKKSGKHFQKYCVRKILVLTIAFAPKGIT